MTPTAPSEVGTPGSCWKTSALSVRGSKRFKPPPMVPTQTSPELPSSIAMTRSSLKLPRSPFTRRTGVTLPVVRSMRLMPLPKVPIHNRPSLSSANEVMLRSVNPSSALARL
jgi:hypothetical protein